MSDEPLNKDELLVIPARGTLSNTLSYSNNNSKLDKSNFIKYLDYNLDDYDSIELTEDEADKIFKHLRRLSTGYTAVSPMNCNERCPIKEKCVLYQMGKAPLRDKKCPIEMQLMKEWTLMYLEEYNVDTNNFTEVGYINELAEIELLLTRLNYNLSKPENAMLLIEQAVGVTREGVVTQTQISPVMLQKEKLHKRKSQIVKLMVGDRQEQYKKEAALKIRQDKDPSTKMADMRSKLENLQRQLTDASLFKEVEVNPKKDPAIITPEDIIDSV